MHMSQEHPLKTLRIALRLTQEKLAETLGISAPFVSQVETGAQPLGRSTVLAICDEYRRELRLLRITAEDLLRGVKQPTEPEQLAQ